MKLSFVKWLSALLVVLAVYASGFAAFYEPRDTRLERSSGPQIEFIGGSALAAMQNKFEHNETTEEVKEDVKEPEEEEPLKENKVEKVDETESEKKVEEVKPDEILTAAVNKIEKKKEEKIKKIEKKTEEQSKKIKPKKKTVKKKLKKTKIKKKKKKTPRKVQGRKKPAANKKGGGSKGRKERVAGNASISNYRGRLQSHLLRYRRFPGEARRHGLTGKNRVIVKFTVTSSGKVISARIKRSSGNTILDRAALSTVRKASPVPPPPSSLGSPVSFSIPIDYTLR